MEDFDRITFRCGRCGNLGLISAVSINLTRVVLEGFCAHCRYAEKKTIDILEVDRWLNERAQTSENRGVECAQPEESVGGDQGGKQAGQAVTAPEAISTRAKRGVQSAPNIRNQNQWSRQEPRTGTW